MLANFMTADEVEEFENKVCPTCGSCSGMYTANSLNCLTEVLGMDYRAMEPFQLCILRELSWQNMLVCK